eukprot:SAG31_NODE_15931_length_731_cov_0.645570_1_plen_238_part_01
MSQHRAMGYLLMQISLVYSTLTVQRVKPEVTTACMSQLQLSATQIFLRRLVLDRCWYNWLLFACDQWNPARWKHADGRVQVQAGEASLSGTVHVQGSNLLLGSTAYDVNVTSAADVQIAAGERLALHGNDVDVRSSASSIEISVGSDLNLTSAADAVSMSGRGVIVTATVHEIVLESAQSLTARAGTNINISAASDVLAKAAASLDLDAADVHINVTSGVSIAAGAALSVQSNGTAAI